MADPLSFNALASSDYVLSSAENFVLYVLLEAVARRRWRRVGSASPAQSRSCARSVGLDV